MEFIEWNDAMSVGVKYFDDEHKQLITLLNNLNHSLSIRATQKTMSDILVNLVKYTVIHFKHEEEYMALYDYPAIIQHKKEHEELTRQVLEFKERLDEGKGSFSIELLTFLRDWLTNHILGSDMVYKEFFHGKGVC